MATTAIDKTRCPAAMQKYNDAVFMRDDKYFYFGNDGDESIHYDSTSDTLVISSINLADDTLLSFGTNKDESLSYDSVSDVITATSLNLADGKLLTFGTNKDVSLKYDATSDCLVLLTISSDNPGIAGGLFKTRLSDATSYAWALTVSSG